MIGNRLGRKTARRLHAAIRENIILLVLHEVGILSLRVRFPPPPPIQHLLANHSRPPETTNNQPVTTSFRLIIGVLNCPSLSLNVHFSALKLHANCTEIWGKNILVDAKRLDS